MKVFLDTNVILDYYLNREGADVAEAILAIGYGKACDLYVSALTFSNIAYIARKKYPGENIYTVLDSLKEFANVTNVDSSVVQSALSLRAKDFEDAMQYYSAMTIGADCIVTSNTKDFQFSEIEILTPSEFIQKKESSSMSGKND